MTDTLAVDVHTANEHDSKAAFVVLSQLKGRFEQMRKIYADGGYQGELVDKVKHELSFEMVITLRSDKPSDFKPLPKRWVVERSFVWLGDFRRLAKDYERTLTSATNMIYLAFIALMLKWL